MTIKASQLIEMRLEKLREDFIASIPHKLREMDSAWAALAASEWAVSASIELYIFAHKIRSPLGMYGLYAVAALAETLENQLEPKLHCDYAVLPEPVVAELNSSYAALLQGLQGLQPV